MPRQVAANASSDSDAVLTAALLNDTAGPFLALQRYAAAAERTGYRALKQLLSIRKLEAQTARGAAQRNEPNFVSPAPVSA